MSLNARLWLYNSWNDHLEVENLKFCGKNFEFRVKNQISSQKFWDFEILSRAF